MQPFLTKTLLSMLAGSFHLACKVTLTSRREAILPSPLYILLNTTQRYYFVISLQLPLLRGADAHGAEMKFSSCLGEGTEVSVSF